MNRKAFQYRIYPNKAQEEKLLWTLTRCRELYNAALQERRDAWNACKNHPNFYDNGWRKEHAKDYCVSLFDQINQLPTLKQEDREEYQEIGSHVLQNVLRRVDSAFQAFFRRVQSGQTAGYPRFQGRDRYDSFCFPDHAGWKIEGKKLLLSKIGEIKLKFHRPLEGTVKTCTMKRDGSHWYVTFVCEVEIVHTLPSTDQAIGIDLGLLHFATTSDGDTIDNPRCYRRGEKKREKAQQNLARKKRGSNRRKKAVRRVASCHRKVRNQRKDFLHQQSRQLVNTYELIVFEDLKPANMSRAPKPKQDEETGAYLPNGAAAKAGLNKSIRDTGWGTFITMCENKAANAGSVHVVRVNPKNTSQICSACFQKGPHKDLSERTHTCTFCGVVLDRDWNAAINILRLGRSHQEIPVS